MQHHVDYDDSGAMTSNTVLGFKPHGPSAGKPPDARDAQQRQYARPKRWQGLDPPQSEGTVLSPMAVPRDSVLRQPDIAEAARQMQGAYACAW
jgi:hypothetical protein